MTKARLTTCFALALFLALCLPLAAFAGIMDDANGTWKLDVEKTAKANGGEIIVPFDVVVIDKANNTLIMRDTKTQSDGPMQFTVQNASATGADLQLTGGPVLRLEMKGKKELSLIGQAEGHAKEVLHFKR